ncbi:MAG: hypothetical protein WCK59_01740 [Candidatus Falkowbacteria bacterium]
MKNIPTEFKQPFVPESEGNPEKLDKNFSNLNVFKEEVASGEEIIEIVKMKIDDKNKLSQVREDLGLEIDKDIQIQMYIDALPKNKDYIDFSKLQKIGSGGTHDVFIDPNNPNFVIKLNRNALEKASSLSQSDWSDETQKKVNEYVEGENDKNKQLYKFFGVENCLSEKVMMAKINIEHNNESQNINGVISIQETSDVFKNPTKKDFSIGYVEKGELFKENKDVYDDMNRALFGSADFSEEDVLLFNEKLKPIFELVDTDQKFADSMREFLVRFKDYFEASGHFIDLVGEENVLFYQKDGNWSFKLGSVIKQETKQGMETALDSLRGNPDTLNQDESLRNQLINQLAVSRLLNAAGIKVGIGKVVDIELSEKQLENLDKVKF